MYSVCEGEGGREHEEGGLSTCITAGSSLLSVIDDAEGGRKGEREGERERGIEPILSLKK